MAILVIEHSNRSGSDRLGIALRDYGHRLNVIRIEEGDELPPDLDNVHGIVSCGGPQAAYDDSNDWLEHEMMLMREAHELSLPIVGICLGCQVLARALGGNVEPMSNGIEFGWQEVSLTPVGREEVIFSGMPWDSLQFQHHRDHVSELPQDARLLAGSSHCKVQAWAIGLRTYGFQFHPEVTIERIEQWADEEPECLQESGLSIADLRESTEENFAAFERVTRRLFESIALFLMPVDRRYKGLVKDLHH